VTSAAVVAGIAGSESRGHNVIIKAQVPLAKCSSYANDLISKTQGRAVIPWSFRTTTTYPANSPKRLSPRTKAVHGEQLVEEEA